jgi:membrane-bound lytic murein transglycosylase D
MSRAAGPVWMFLTVPALGLGATGLSSSHAAGTSLASFELTPRANERKAVRGSWAPEVVQSWEIRELDRFEREAFNRATLARLRVIRADDDGVLPPGFASNWAGSGDDAGQGNGPVPGLVDPHLQMRWDAEVLKYVEYLTSDPAGRSVMAGLLRRKARYEKATMVGLARERVPGDLIYLALVESALEPGAQWNDGSAGPWRLTVAMARTYGLEVGFWQDARRDPELAASAGARRLKDLLSRFGSWPLAMAAYRVGPDVVSNLVFRLGTNDYQKLRDRRDGLPREALLFVARVLGTALVGRNTAAFGWPEPAPAAGAARETEAPRAIADRGMVHERIAVPPGTSLATVARAAGIAVETLRALNPDLVRDRVPPDRSAYELRVPPGSARAVVHGLQTVATTTEQLVPYLLRVGESLDDVAGAYRIPARELRRLNGVREAGELRGGVTLLLPARVMPRPGERAPSPEQPPMLVAVPGRQFQYPERDRVYYRICEGDTLEELAPTFRVEIPEIVSWNNLDPSARLQAGMVLQLHVPSDLDRSRLRLLDPRNLRVVSIGSEEFHEMETALRGKTRLFYAARSGDTLNKIARRYGLASPDLARINRISWNSELRAGQEVIVYSPTPGLAREGAVGRSASERRPSRSGIEAPKATAAASRGGNGKPARAGVATLAPLRSARSAMAPKAAAAASRGASKPAPVRRGGAGAR